MVASMPFALDIANELGNALSFAFGMLWEILWALILGFGLSAVVQAVVAKSEMRRLLPDDSARTIARATLRGAASSSCSYAAVARAIVRAESSGSSRRISLFATTAWTTADR